MPWFQGLLRRLALDRPESRAWAMYDWANSAFMLTVVTTVFPIYFLQLAEGQREPQPEPRIALQPKGPVRMRLLPRVD